MFAGEQKMHKSEELESKIKNELEKIDLEVLKENVHKAQYLHDKIIPLINEVVMSATGKESYEDAYKAVIDKLRAVHQTIAQEKINAETLLMTSAGKKQALTSLLPEVTEIANDHRSKIEKVKSEKIAKIADKIQSGTLDPEEPRKIGTRPESLKNIRIAKATLFGEANQSKDQED